MNSLNVEVSVPCVFVCICFTWPTDINPVSKSLISKYETHVFGHFSGHMFERKLFFPLVWRFTSCPSYTKYGHFPQLTDLSCEVKYSHSAENYTIFHANISGAIQYHFFVCVWSALLNGQMPKLWLSWSPHQTQNLPGIMWVLQTCAGGSRALLVLFKSLYFVLNQRP